LIIATFLNTAAKAHKSAVSWYRRTHSIPHLAIGNSVKLVIVGDTGIGKTSLLVTYTSKAFPYEYIPTILDVNQMNVIVDGEVTSLAPWDISGETPCLFFWGFLGRFGFLVLNHIWCVLYRLTGFCLCIFLKSRWRGLRSPSSVELSSD
jgi:hypothetical protein